jgi:hypothetical protein
MPTFPPFLANVLQDPQPQRLSIVASKLKRLSPAQSQKERAAARGERGAGHQWCPPRLKVSLYLQ